MKASKESRVLLGLVIGSIVLLCVPFAWPAKLICGPLSLAAVSLAGRKQSRLRTEASMDERDFLLVAQAFGLLTVLAWALFLCYVWPMRPGSPDQGRLILRNGLHIRILGIKRNITAASQ